MIPDVGWFVTSRSPQYSYARVLKGLHGYDNNIKTMRVSKHQLLSRLYDGVA